MSMALFIIGVALAILGFGSQRFRIKSTKWKGRRSQIDQLGGPSVRQFCR